MNVIIIGTFEMIKGSMHGNNNMTAFDGELLNDSSPHFDNSCKMKEFGECWVIKLLGKQVTSLILILQSVFFSLSGSILVRFLRGPIEMAKDLFLLENPFEVDLKMIQLKLFISSFGTDEKDWSLVIADMVEDKQWYIQVMKDNVSIAAVIQSKVGLIT